MNIEELLVLNDLKLSKIVISLYGHESKADLNALTDKFDIDKYDLNVSKVNSQRILEGCKKHNIDIISYFDGDYPNEFKLLEDAPLVLFKKGEFTNKPRITIAGTRNPSNIASKLTKEIAICVQRKGFSIVSGLARGVDSIAHQSSVKNLTDTTAILPCNLNNIYPKENKKLADEILENGGCLISEYSLIDEIKKYHFIKRDRLQAAYSSGVIVIETAANGGTMHTAKYAKKYCKKLFCVKFSNGNNKSYYKSGNDILLEDSYTIPIENISDLQKSLDKMLGS